jgi:sec-independent protein translocase protein TatA
MCGGREPGAEDRTMGFLSEPTHWIFILILLFVLFGAKRLPELGKGLGEGLKGFKEGLKGITDPTPAAPTVQPTVQQTAAPAPPLASKPAAEMDYVVCSRCGNRFENPLGFKVTEYVCRSCQSRG